MNIKKIYIRINNMIIYMVFKCNDYDDIYYSLNVFHALDSAIRLNILKSLLNDKKHISKIAREFEISIPVASKHTTILEETGLIKREIHGRSHVLSYSNQNLVKPLDIFAPIKEIVVDKGSNLLDILNQTAYIKTKKLHDREHVISINGEEGLFIYEIDGSISYKTVKDCIIDTHTSILWKKLEPVSKLRLNINVKK